MGAITEVVLTDAGDSIQYLAEHVPKCRSVAAPLVHLRRQLAECTTPRNAARTDGDEGEGQNSITPSKIMAWRPDEEGPLLDFSSDGEENQMPKVPHGTAPDIVP